jgi:cytochrome c-type biogenesis protein CcmE
MQRRRLKFVIVGLLLTSGAIAFAVATLYKPGVSLTHFTPDQIAKADPTDIAGRGVQVDGFVAEGTERFDPNVPELRFQVRDVNGTAFVDVVYRAGLKPDTFQEGQGVVVDGRYDPATRTIHASKLMTKCPSKYEASAASLKAASQSGASPNSADRSVEETQ